MTLVVGIVLDGLLLAGSTALTLVLLLVVSTTILALIAKAKIGGQTGDILGASQQLAEIAALSVMAASL